MTGDSRKDVSVEVPSGNIKAEGGAVGPQLRHRNPNSAKFEMEEKTGNIWSEDLGRFVSYHRMIDRKNDLYYEKIVDDETGEVLRKCEEPLSGHTGHGSDKNKEDDQRTT